VIIILLIPWEEAGDVYLNAIPYLKELYLIFIPRRAMIQGTEDVCICQQIIVRSSPSVPVNIFS
jgi:hypothetical protein